MILRRPATTRGATRGDGFDRRHAFSSGRYHDPAWMGFGPLRVFNEDRVAPGGAFPEQHHGNMELLIYVLSGALAHRDGAGNEGVLHPGGVLWIGAGHGIDHAVANASPDEPLHLLQAWLQPDRVNAPPDRMQREFDPMARRGQWAALATPDGADCSLPIRQDARLLGVLLAAGDVVPLDPDPARRYWLHVAQGEVVAGGDTLSAGDALGLHGEAASLLLRGRGPGTADVLLFDLP